ncbi:MAG TPA: SIS domain-containing protein [Tepidisphaeraceae bacterium]|jgi:glucosamine--fructose-6-phosphate aminotransferase (isomerizing)|nr:SIS domain-containing protein [Tepidisphaeraceae bacterium]
MCTERAIPLIEGPYLRDLLLQPDSLRAAVAGVASATSAAAVMRDVHRGRFSRVVLTGMGSSFYALYPLHLALSDMGLHSVWVETSELLHGFIGTGSGGDDALLVAVSQSGESAEIVQLTSRARRFGHVIGISNDPSSTLGRAADTLLPLNAGPEATVSCKTYIATLAVLHWLARAMEHDDLTGTLADLETARIAVAGHLANWRDHVAQWRQLVDGVDAVFVTGRGVSLATAGTGGLILKESTGRPAEGMSCAAFRHGPLEMAGNQTLVLIFAGDPITAPLNAALYDDIIRGGGHAALIHSAAADNDNGQTSPFRIPAVASALRPLVEILPVQMLSLAIAARDGREAGRFTRASKITTVN